MRRCHGKEAGASLGGGLGKQGNKAGDDSSWEMADLEPKVSKEEGGRAGEWA